MVLYCSAHVGLRVKLSHRVEREGVGVGAAHPNTPPLHPRTDMSRIPLSGGGCRLCRQPPPGKRRSWGGSASPTPNSQSPTPALEARLAHLAQRVVERDSLGQRL